MPSDWAFVSVDMEITNQCGSECLMCPRDGITRPRGMMLDEVFKAVSDKLIREGSLRVREKITSHFRISFSGHLCPIFTP